jgi:hypothetical protein
MKKSRLCEPVAIQHTKYDGKTKSNLPQEMQHAESVPSHSELMYVYSQAEDPAFRILNRVCDIFSLSGFASTSAWYSLKVLTPSGIPFAPSFSSATNRSLVSMAFLKESRVGIHDGWNNQLASYLPLADRRSYRALFHSD